MSYQDQYHGSQQPYGNAPYGNAPYSNAPYGNGPSSSAALNPQGYGGEMTSVPSGVNYHDQYRSSPQPYGNAPYSSTPYGASAPGSTAALNARSYGGEVAAAPAKSKRKMWIIIAVIVVLVLGGAGAGIGIALSNKSASTSSAGDDGKSDNSTTTPDAGTNVTDYSVFEKNPEFHKVFYAMAYTPSNGQYPNCGLTLEDVIRDVQLMSQLTNTVRIYGADCNLPDFFLEAVKLTKTDIKVYLGNYAIIAKPESYTGSKAKIEAAIKKHGADAVLGVTVGNELMLNYALAHDTKDANDPVTQPAADYLVASIADTRASLAALGYPNIKVGTADAGSYFNDQVLSAADYGLSNIHAWFASVTVSESVQWTWNFFQWQNTEPAALLPNKPEMFIAETGWPSYANLTANPLSGNTGAGVGGEASIANLQIFLDEFVCQSNAKGIKYFYFELYDQTWKDERFGGVEGYWGLLDKDQKLKPGLKLPTCQ